MVKALIFDVDGTLAETERDVHRVAFNAAFQAAGLNWHWSVDTYGTLLTVAGGKERIQYFIDQYHPQLPPGAGGKGWIAALHKGKTYHYRHLIRSGKIALRPGVRRLLQEARQSGVRLAIATTSHLDNVLALLTATLGSEGVKWFEVIAAGDMVPHKKPAPDVYHYALNALALDPQQCLAIEDSDQGLQAAIAAGLTTVVTVNDYTRHENLAAAALVLSHLGEPDCPCEILAGKPWGDRYFTLAAASTLLLCPH